MFVIKKIFMNKIISLIVLIFITLQITAQTKVEKSKDKVFILGREYYIHKVKPGETIYSISKVYNVPREEILYINKEEVQNLQTGSILRIPKIDSNYVPSPLTKTSFKEHTVQKKESLYSIAQQYGITQDDIIKYNPQIKNGLKKGMVLKIPITENEQLSATDEFFIYHQIKNGETLQLLAQEYGITVEDIKEFNENLSSLTPGKTIAIPKKELSEEQKHILKFNESLSPDFFDIDPNYFEDPNYPPCNKFVFNDTMTFKIAFLLPLFINDNYNLSYNALKEPENAHYFSNSKIFYDYLQGSLMAIKQLKKENLNLKIYIYDTKADSNEVKDILNKYELSKMDLIFGPVYSQNYNIVKKFSEKNKINIVSPLSRNNIVVENKPFVFQVEPSFTTITKFSAEYIAQYADTSFITVISNGTPQQQAIADTFFRTLSVLTNTDSLDYKKITFSKFITPYQKNLKPDKNNIVFIPGTNEVEVSAILNNLNALVTVNEYRITVYAMPVIQNYTKLQAEWLSNLNIHYATTVSITDETWEIKEFNQKYKRIFGRRPTKFAYIGYDATYYFLDAMRHYGKYFQFCMGENTEILNSGMFVKFNFKRYNKQSGFENRKLNMLYYTKELRIEKEKEPVAKINTIFE